MAPHDPGQGSRQCWAIQASCGLHSIFEIHSGRQFGGLPMKPSKHEHDGLSFSNLLHWELGPQGDGMHGFWGGITVGCSTEIQFFFFFKQNYSSGN